MGAFRGGDIDRGRPPGTARLGSAPELGDPMSSLRWTVTSTRVLAAELTRLGHQAGSSLVGRMLHYLGYSLQANAKVTEGAQHPDRDAQFRQHPAGAPVRLKLLPHGPEASAGHPRGEPGQKLRARRSRHPLVQDRFHRGQAHGL
ncbi:MAG: ISAzo13-like element transposase-related protein [Acidimicrobiales bacterium]